MKTTQYYYLKCQDLEEKGNLHQNSGAWGLDNTTKLFASKGKYSHTADWNWPEERQ